MIVVRPPQNEARSGAGVLWLSHAELPCARGNRRAVNHDLPDRAVYRGTVSLPFHPASLLTSESLDAAPHYAFRSPKSCPLLFGIPNV